MKHGVTERDTGISELIKHFDQYEDAYKLDPTCIPHKEQLVLAEEIQKCHDSFEYAARNYFWIINKKRIDQLLVLNEGQELIYEKIKQLRAKNLPQKLMIIKARQLGCSTLIEGLIAWKSMFFPSTNAMVVSNVGAHATYLFGLMTHILDQLPWWMRPMTSSRQEEDGLVFKNPDQAQRRNNPGLNSWPSLRTSS